MRSRALPARAFYRLVAGQQQQQSSSTSSAASTSTNGTTARATTRASTVATPSARLSRAAAAARRRQETGTGTSNAMPVRRRRSTSKRPDVPMILVNPSVQQLWNQSSKQLHMHLPGITPATPPQTSLTSVALQKFFAGERPLLEHHVIAGSSEGQDQLEQDSLQDQETRDRLETISAELLKSLHESGHVSASELKHATVVIAAATEAQTSFPKRVDNIDQDRFVTLLDRLAGDGMSGNVNGVQLVQQEAQSLESEDRQRKDIETAVSNALERGEDPSVAKSLGTEADLVILGEPEGPHPSWARGVATHLAQYGRAFEPPAAPAHPGEQALAAERESGQASASIKIIDEREDDPNMLLSHAMVQATLPPALAWDRLVAQMDSVTLGDKARKAVDVGVLDANVSASGEDNEVALDSTKRKRRKKMRKHKYRKLRKATRIERSRLKK